MGWDARRALGIGQEIGGKILKLGVGIGIAKISIRLTLLASSLAGKAWHENQRAEEKAQNSVRSW